MRAVMANEVKSSTFLPLGPSAVENNNPAVVSAPPPCLSSKPIVPSTTPCDEMMPDSVQSKDGSGKSAAFGDIRQYLNKSNELDLDAKDSAKFSKTYSRKERLSSRTMGSSDANKQKLAESSSRPWPSFNGHGDEDCLKNKHSTEESPLKRDDPYDLKHVFSDDEDKEQTERVIHNRLMLSKDSQKRRSLSSGKKRKRPHLGVQVWNTLYKEWRQNNDLEEKRKRERENNIEDIENQSPPLQLKPGLTPKSFYGSPALTPPPFLTKTSGARKVDRNPRARKSLLTDIELEPSESTKLDSRPSQLGQMIPFSQLVSPSSSISITVAKAPETIGFHNSGNTCYQNAVLQCIFGCQDFVRELKEFSYKTMKVKDTRDSVFDTLNTLLTDKNNSRSSEIIRRRLREFKSVFEKVHPSFAGTRQQDAHEFLLHLLSTTHEEIVKAQIEDHEESDNCENKQSLVTKNFQFEVAETRRCQKCSKATTQKSNSTIFKLNLPSKREESEILTVQKLFQDSTRSLLQLDCNTCKEKVDHEIIETFSKLPKVLIVFVPRMSFSKESQESRKNCIRIILSETLSCTNFCDNDSKTVYEAFDPTVLKKTLLQNSGNQKEGVLTSNGQLSDKDLSKMTEEEQLKAAIEQSLHCQKRNDLLNLSEEDQIKLALEQSLMSYDDDMDSDEAPMKLLDSSVPAGSQPVDEYRLTGIVCHLGREALSGHYVSYFRRKDEWLEMDDENVSKRNIEVVQEKVSRNCYLLFYFHKSLLDHGK